MSTFSINFRRNCLVLSHINQNDAKFRNYPYGILSNSKHVWFCSCFRRRGRLQPKTLDGWEMPPVLKGESVFSHWSLHSWKAEHTTSIFFKNVTSVHSEETETPSIDNPHREAYIRFRHRDAFVHMGFTGLLFLLWMRLRSYFFGALLLHPPIMNVARNKIIIVFRRWVDFVYIESTEPVYHILLCTVFIWINFYFVLFYFLQCPLFYSKMTQLSPFYSVPRRLHNGTQGDILLELCYVRNREAILFIIKIIKSEIEKALIHW